MYIVVAVVMVLRRFVGCVRSCTPLLRVCVVGAGPAGLYTVERLLKRPPAPIEIDVLDRLPFPFGLVETGVAPDHPETKNVRSSFERVLQNDRCRFYGNVHVGKDVSFECLRRRYHAVVLSYGAEADRKLGVEGEGGKGVITAREFVWWYNGHPDCSDREIDLSNVRNVAVVGAGNVALDCARILLKPWKAFEKTDMSHKALEALKHSAVQNVHLVARRGVAHAKFTSKELRDILRLHGLRTIIDHADLRLSAEEREAVSKVRRKKRVVEVLQQAVEDAREAQFDGSPFSKTLQFHFTKCIDRIDLTSHGSVQSIQLRRNLPPTEFEADEEILQPIDVDLLIGAIGTTSFPLEGLPFNSTQGFVSNLDGRVTDSETGEVQQGVYVSGWAKRGASGIIGTNIIDAEEVTEAIRKDTPLILQSHPCMEHSLPDLLSQKGIRVVQFSDWQKLREVECERGREQGKEREKLLSLDAMLKICCNHHRAH